MSAIEERNRRQREYRQRLARERGWSTSSHYRAGGNREAVLKRDGFACVRCGMTDAEHKATWNRPITVDHIDRDRSNNALSNLQTLCLRCHGSKDILPELIVPKVPEKKEQILSMRRQGYTYQEIAEETGFSIGAVWKWVQRWTADEDAERAA